MEHWEELKPGGLRMVWDDELFRPGTDSFLLSSFPKLKSGLRVCDLGSGTGLLGLLLLQREPSLDVMGIEIQPEAASLAERCAVENRLDGGNSPGRLRTLCADLREARQVLPPGGFDLVVSNPPYYESGRGRQSPDGIRRLARSGCTLADVIRAGAYLLRNGGAFYLCQKPERLTDALCLLREADCEPKRARFVCRSPADAPSLVLLEGRRGGKPGLAVEPPLILYRTDGSPTEELDRIYFRV
ncbi:MAG: methyltransferase [Oscillibacter sp.]|nr:methyltransferase [Oscillibacter sp.]